MKFTRVQRTKLGCYSPWFHISYFPLNAYALWTEIYFTGIEWEFSHSLTASRYDFCTFPPASNFVSITCTLKNMKYNINNHRLRKSAVCREYFLLLLSPFVIKEIPFSNLTSSVTLSYFWCQPFGWILGAGWLSERTILQTDYKTQIWNQFSEICHTVSNERWI